MEEVCEVGPKNLRKNFRVQELFSTRKVSRYYPSRKSFVMSTPKLDSFMQLF